MLEHVAGSILALALGGVGWITFHLFGAPYTDLRQLRRESYEALIFTANVGSWLLDHDEDGNLYRPDGPEILRVHSEDLRRLSVKVTAADEMATGAVRYFVRTCHGWDPELAARGLMALSTSLQEPFGVRAPERFRVEKGFRLPHEMNEEDVRAEMKEHRDPDR
ncbi:hypothetical protein [Thalassobaculum litoreum]|uniref:hypothetical protein n=1 Tax=Thalassobaculum litoreum TaxID=420996 RepID=UPI001113E5D0|nr:hypothetical protein [Thalassobaculum litoreum]